MTQIPSPTLLGLPAEILDQIISYLSPFDVAKTSKTCRLLNSHCLKDEQWRKFVQEQLPTPITSASPYTSFRDLFMSLHPYFFLARHKIWFSDNGYHGKIVISRYDPRRGCIDAYTLVAERTYTHGTLAWDPPVLYQTFHPIIQLDLNLPVIHLGTQEAKRRQMNYFRFDAETSMRPREADGSNVSSTFMHARNLPNFRIDAPVQLWPPLKLPSPYNQRILNSSSDSFRSVGHKPSSVLEASDAAFRIRQWIEFRHWFPFVGGGGRVGETVTNYGTLPPEVYTPTKEKPWQGIWVGDYSAHGCEFLVIMQPDKPAPLPEKARRAFANWSQSRFSLYNNYGDPLSDDEDGEAYADDGISAYERAFLNEHGVLPGSMHAVTRFRAARQPPIPDPESRDPPPFRGRLEAVKLTGDPNVPRGEYTFIVNDLGEGGLVGYAQDDIFNPDGEGDDRSRGLAAAAGGDEPHQRGARMVRSVGHIAHTGYVEDKYIPSQLILISENKLAQYWRPFEHISFYERVDIDKLLAELG